MKVGRNDPCPCGSGKKYKRCCGGPDAKVIPFPESVGDDEGENGGGPFSWDDARGDETHQERLGRPNAATEVIQRMRAEMRNRSFESKGEIEAFIEDFVSRDRRAPRDDFLGLSSEQMHAILNGGARAMEGVVELRGGIVESDLTSIPLLDECVVLLGCLAESESVKATERGNLPRSLVQRWWEKAFRSRMPEKLRGFVTTPRSERDDWSLAMARLFIQEAGLIKKRAGRFSLTSKGRTLREAADLSALYGALFEAVGWKIDWNAERDEFRSFHPLLQDSFIFNLHLLGCLARSWLSEDKLVDAYVRAFPALLADYGEPVGGLGRRYLEISIGLGITLYPIELGLLERRGGIDFPGGALSVSEYRVTPLFDRLLAWKDDLGGSRGA